jgi:hypothetical protein
MATRSTITVRTSSNERKEIYCHWDGYPDHVGKILKEHYNTQEKAEALIALGDLSSLEPSISAPDGEEHSFNKPYTGVCVAYGRDRGNSDTSARTKTNSEPTDRQAFNYFFENGEWSYTMD